MTRPDTSDRTVAAVRGFLDALGSQTFHVGVQNAKGMMRQDDLAPEQVLKRIDRLRFHNLRGNHIYIQPVGEHRLTLLDDLNAGRIQRLAREGYAPSAVVETSPGNFQAWLKHPEPLMDEQASLAARLLAERFGADPNAAGKRRFGRLPGFTNTKDKYKDAKGRFPYVLLRAHSGRSFPEASAFRRELERRTIAESSQHTPARRSTLSPRRGGRSSYLSLPRFRALPQYAGQPARADIAFTRAVLQLGMERDAVAQVLASEYLSRNESMQRKAAYIERTIGKAVGSIQTQITPQRY